MSNSQIQCQYTVWPAGQLTGTQLKPLVASAPLDNDFLLFRGLRLVSDTTSEDGPNSAITRTIVLAMGPSIAATASAAIDPGSETSPIVSYRLTNADHPGGLDYVRPPVVTITDPTGSGATAHAELGVVDTNGLNGGANYDPSTTLVASGGQLAPGGSQATFSLVIVGGVIQSVTVLTPGGPYNVPPTLTFVDPTQAGAGASVNPRLGINRIVGDQPGQSYGNPTVTITPYFKSMCPDTDFYGNDTSASQAATVANFMTTIIQANAGTPVLPATPQVS